MKKILKDGDPSPAKTIADKLPCPVPRPAVADSSFPDFHIQWIDPEKT